MLFISCLPPPPPSLLNVALVTYRRSTFVSVSCVNELNHVNNQLYVLQCAYYHITTTEQITVVGQHTYYVHTTMN